MPNIKPIGGFMDIQDLADRLRLMYSNAPKGEQTTYIRLFGIKYADEIAGLPLVELIERAGLKRSYDTEVRKGVRLAKYVELKEWVKREC